MTKCLTLEKKHKFIDVGIVFLFIISAFIFLIESPLHPWGNGQMRTDSSVFETIAMMMHKGFMPYKDSFDHKGSLIYFYNWLGFFIGHKGVWFIEFISLATALVIMYGIARLVCKRLWATITTYVALEILFISFEGGNLTEEYALPFIACSLYIFLDYFLNKKINTCRFLICGYCFAAVCLLRVNMISTYVFFCFGILYDCICKKKYKELRRFICWFAAGGGICFLG